VKILVTGGAGFIGSNFVRHVLTTHPDDSVVNLDKLTYAGNLQNLADFASEPRYRFVQGDICDGALVRDLIAGVDAVVHFAAETHVDRSNTGAGPRGWAIAALERASKTAEMAAPLLIAGAFSGSASRGAAPKPRQPTSGTQGRHP